MRALFTGASSFTGLAFAEALAWAGIEVTATCRQRLDDYRGVRRQRLERLRPVARLVEGTSFGDPAFLDLLASDGPFQLLCLHGAEVGDFRRPGFDPMQAAAANSHRATEVMRILAGQGGRAVLVTGSVFEADEGAGGAVDAYGLAKTLSWHLLRQPAEQMGLAVGKLVIPHPFGAFDKPGLVRSLIEGWLAHQAPVIRSPQLRRDFVHADLLADAYARLALRLVEGGAPLLVWRPSLYRESVADFAHRLAAELRPRLGRACEIRLADPVERSPEPLERFNSDPLPGLLAACPLGRSWDRLALYYL